MFEQRQKMMIISMVLMGLFFFISVFALQLAKPAVDSGRTSPSSPSKTYRNSSSMVKKWIPVIKQVTETNKLKKVKCELSASGLANCFEMRLIVMNKNGNVLEMNDLTKLTFKSNSKCHSSKDCSVTVGEINSKKEYFTLPLYADRKGFLFVKNSDTKKILKDNK